jgi:DnaJ-domain-containing protein 1
LELATAQAELHSFEREYLRVVGVRYAELDEIEAEIAKYLAFLNPLDSTARKQAEQAWAKAQDSKRATDENVTDSVSSRDFKPPESLKKLYREIAKRTHPDLATDEAERLRRQKLMAEANQAYEDGDEERLQAILHGGESSPESVQGEGVETELIRTIRKIAQVRERLKRISAEIEALKRSALYQLREKAIAAQQAGRDLLAEMASQIDEQIAAGKVRLEELRAKVGF